MRELVSPEEQVTRVATLLGRAVLRWKREKESSSGISEIIANSLPERLNSRPVSSLSVTGQNDEATGLEETGSENEMMQTKHVRGTMKEDCDPDRGSGLAKCEQASRAAINRSGSSGRANNRRNNAPRHGGQQLVLT